MRRRGSQGGQLAPDAVAVRLQELEAPRRQVPRRNSRGHPGVHSEVTRVTDFVESSKDRIEVDSARLPERKIPRDYCCARGPRNLRGPRGPGSTSSGGDDAGFDGGLLRAGRQGRPGTVSALEHPLILRINVEYLRGDAPDHVWTIALRIVHPIHRLVSESKVRAVDLFQTVNSVIDIRKQRPWMRQMDNGEAALLRLIARALRPAEMLRPLNLAANQLRPENLSHSEPRCNIE